MQYTFLKSEKQMEDNSLKLFKLIKSIQGIVAI